MYWECGYCVCHLMHLLLNAVALIHAKSKMLQVASTGEHHVPSVTCNGNFTHGWHERHQVF